MDNHEREIVMMLRELGIRPHLKGYTYIKAGIKMLLEKPDLLYGITKEFYPAIAKEYKTAPSRVERGIRHAIRSAECNISLTMRLFGTVEHVCNSQYLATVTEELRMRILETNGKKVVNGN